MSDTPEVNDARPLKLAKSKLFNKKEVVDSDRVKLLEAAKAACERHWKGEA